MVKPEPFYHQGICLVKNLLNDAAAPCKLNNGSYICSDILPKEMMCKGLSFEAQTCDE